MKKFGDHTRIRKGGILHWSTLCLLAGSSMGLISCDSESTYTATAEDAKMAALQQSLDEIEHRRLQLMNGLVEHNFHLEDLGYYHAEANDFFPYRYGHKQNGKWFVNGEWVNTQPGISSVTASYPSAEALHKVELLLEQEQEQELVSQSNSDSSNSTTHNHHHHSSGVGSMLMMYWMLSGNRNNYTPGSGFRKAEEKQLSWHHSIYRQRNIINTHAATNPAYNQLVQQSKSNGRPVTQGSSVRGGFGTSQSSRSSWGS